MNLQIKATCSYKQPYDHQGQTGTWVYFYPVMAPDAAGTFTIPCGTIPVDSTNPAVDSQFTIGQTYLFNITLESK